MSPNPRALKASTTASSIVGAVRVQQAAVGQNPVVSACQVVDLALYLGLAAFQLCDALPVLACRAWREPLGPCGGRTGGGRSLVDGQYSSDRLVDLLGRGRQQHQAARLGSPPQAAVVIGFCYFQLKPQDAPRVVRNVPLVQLEQRGGGGRQSDRGESCRLPSRLQSCSP